MKFIIVRNVILAQAMAGCLLPRSDYSWSWFIVERTLRKIFSEILQWNLYQNMLIVFQSVFEIGVREIVVILFSPQYQS